MKKILLTLLGMLMALPALTRDFYYTYIDNTLKYQVIDENAKTCSVIGRKHSISEDLIIPSVAYDGDAEYTVTAIGDKSLWKSSVMTWVSIPNSVTSIGGYAFAQCTGLTEVTFGNSVTSIGDYAFSSCNVLTSVVIPNSVISIGDGAFWDCKALTSAKIGNSVVSIGESAFYNCINMKSVTIGNSVTSIGDYAFSSCSGLTSITIPNSVTSIGDGAFSSCSGLTSVTIGNSVTSIGYASFGGCSGLTSVTIPKTVTYIGDYAFSRCSGLTSITIPNSVTSIGNNAFNRCSPLKELIIENGEISLSIGSSLGDYCQLETLYLGRNLSYDRSPFVRQETLNILTIGNSVTSIGDGAFSFCSGLKSVIIPTSVTSIGSDAFSYCRGLESITIPNSVTSIGSSAFSSCSGLTSITIPNSVTSIGNGAFSFCSGLIKSAYPNTLENPFYDGFTIAYDPANVLMEDGFIFDHEKKTIYFAPVSLEGEYTIADYVNTIGYASFGGCSGLTSVTIPKTVTYIGDYAFSSCNGLKSITVNWIDPINSSPTCFDESIYNQAVLYAPENTFFAYISSDWNLFENIRIGNNATARLTDGVFSYRILENSANANAILVAGDYSAMTDANIPERFTDDRDPANPVRYYITGIASKAFYNCRELRSVNFNSRSQISSIGNSAFYDCWNLTSVTIPNSVKSIGSSAFQRCSSLSSVQIGNSVKTIGERAFSECRNLTSVTIPNSVSSIGRETFSGCLYLKSVKIGNSVETIGENAFRECISLKDIIVPPSVTTIGDSAFAGATNLASIFVGHKVASIGERAFDKCPASNIYITAQTPPQAHNNTFSNYTGTLYLQGQSAKDAYYDAYVCWDRFYTSALMTEPTGMEYEGPERLEGAPGDQFQLKAQLTPKNVTLPQIFWRSTNPEVATVDHTGLVTIHANLTDSDGTDRSCKIIAESLYANGPKAEVTATDVAGIGSVINDNKDNAEINPDAPLEVYNLSGIKVATSTCDLVPGLYIVRQGSLAKKISVK